MGFPLAVVHALWSPTHRWLYRVALAVIAIDIFLSISRSALVCAAISLVVLAVELAGGACGSRRVVAAVAASLVVYVVGARLARCHDPALHRCGRRPEHRLAHRQLRHRRARSSATARCSGVASAPSCRSTGSSTTATSVCSIEGGLLGLGGLVVAGLVAAWSARAAARALPARASTGSSPRACSPRSSAAPPAWRSSTPSASRSRPAASSSSSGSPGALRRLSPASPQSGRAVTLVTGDPAPDVRRRPKRVAVVVVLYNSAEHLPDFVASLPGRAGRRRPRARGRRQRLLRRQRRS